MDIIHFGCTSVCASTRHLVDFIEARLTGLGQFVSGMYLDTGWNTTAALHTYNIVNKNNLNLTWDV